MYFVFNKEILEEGVPYIVLIWKRLRDLSSLLYFIAPDYCFL